MQRDTPEVSLERRAALHEERLDSWKEIAFYLNRQVRTVRLWEEREGMPVRRHMHIARGSVYAFRSELDRWRECRRPRNGAGRVLLAVSPFENLTGDFEQECFSDGITDGVITQLSRWHTKQFSVIARMPVMLYKGTRKTINEIAGELGVNYILDGSVRRSASRVRVTARLIQVRDQVQVWAEDYDHDLAEAFIIQTRVAQQIAQSLTPLRQVEVFFGSGAVSCSGPQKPFPPAQEALPKQFRGTGLLRAPS